MGYLDWRNGALDEYIRRPTIEAGRRGGYHTKEPKRKYKENWKEAKTHRATAARRCFRHQKGRNLENLNHEEQTIGLEEENAAPLERYHSPEWTNHLVIKNI